MDTPESQEPVDLDVNTAGDALNNLENPPAEKSEEEILAEKAAALVAGEYAPKPEGEPDTQSDSKFTVKVDGKDIELTAEQVAEAYKSGLRQSDYSQKTAALADQRNQAQEAERQRRDDYGRRLEHFEIQLQGALQQQQQIDWQKLLDEDPMEYLKQQHLFQQRQALLQESQLDRGRIAQAQQQEYAASLNQLVANESQQLIQALPAWKDPAKAEAEKAEIKGYLIKQGIPEQDISQIVDHRHIIIARKAMMLDKLLEKAPAAAKKVAAVPLKVEKPGNAEGSDRKPYRTKGALSAEEAGAAINSILG